MLSKAEIERRLAAVEADIQDLKEQLDDDNKTSHYWAVKRVRDRLVRREAYAETLMEELIAIDIAEIAREAAARDKS